MAKKKGAKKASRKPAKKAARKPAKVSGKIPRATRAVKRSKPSKATMAGSVEVIKQPTVDMTEIVREDIVEVKPEPKPAQPAPAPAPVEKHDEFTQALTHEPEKKGFWARLFGKK